VWVTLWLDAIVDAMGDPQRRASLATWDGVARLHPAASFAIRAPAVDELAAAAADLTREWPWSRLRAEGDRWSFPGDIAIAPSLARWMDDGMYARTLFGELPPIATLVHEVAQLVDEPLGIAILEVVDAGL
jgi:hypothetical protein